MLVYNPKADLNKDGVIDILDISYLAKNYTSGNLKYDLNGDGKISIADYGIIVAQHFGTTGNPYPKDTSLVQTGKKPLLIALVVIVGLMLVVK